MDKRMSTGESLERLLERDVFAVDDNDRITLSESFQEAINKAPSSPSIARSDENEGSQSLDENHDVLAAVSEQSPEFLPTLYAIDEFLPDIQPDDIPHVLLAVDRVRYPPKRTSGVPDGFLAVRGSRVKLYIDLLSKAIVYVWQEDCEPCDDAEQALEKISTDIPQDIIPFAVHGPSWADELNEAYDVFGAPTVVFVRNGRVDSRLVGHQIPLGAKSEIEILSKHQ